MILIKKQSQYQNTPQTAIIIQQKRTNNAQLTIKKYTKGKLLGKGGFAKCFQLQQMETKRIYAAKIIQKSSLTKPKSKQKLSSQIKIHMALKFQYIVKFQHVFQDLQNVYILLELCPNQTLNQLIKRRKRITELQAQCYLYQLALAIKYLQNQKIIHRDLKLGNLFLNQKLQIKIGDFGLAAQISKEGQKRKTMCGTPNYIAPQILQNKNGHSYQVDIWSFGVIAYTMLVGRPPFQTADIRSTYSKIRMCNYSFPDTVNLSRFSKNLIQKILQLDPSKRLTIQEILNHQFFTSNPFPKSLPLSTLACPPNTIFMKKFNNQNVETSKNIQESNNISKGGYQRSQQVTLTRTQSTYQRQVQIKKNYQSAGYQQAVPQRAVSSLALNNHKYLVKKNDATDLVIQNKGPQLWVSYCTFDPKFGLAYLLNGRICGMYFVDNTMLINSKYYGKSKYIQMDQDFNEINNRLLQKVQSNQKIEKKIKVITYFENYLLQKKQQEQKKLSSEQLIKRQKLRYKKDTGQNFGKIYIKRYINTKKGYIFLFNNKDIQFIFIDKTQVLIKNNNVVYINKYGQRKQFLIQIYQNMGQQIQKRVSYALKILKSLKITKSNHIVSDNKQNINNNNQNKQNIIVKKHSSIKQGLLVVSSSSSLQKKQIKKSGSISKYPFNYIQRNY